MDFSLSTEQAMIRDNGRNLFSAECPLPLLHAAWQDPSVALPLFDEHLV